MKKEDITKASSVFKKTVKREIGNFHNDISLNSVAVAFREGVNWFIDFVWHENINNIIKTIPKIQGVKFTCLDFRSIDVPENSIVYCDPPYKGTKQYSTSKNFDHDSFWMWVRKVSRKAKVFVSEYSAPEDFECIWEKQITNAMSTKNTYKPTEKLFVLKGV